MKPINATSSHIDRRSFLGTTAANMAAVTLATQCPASVFAFVDANTIVGRIDSSVIFNGRKSDHTWFHPRPCSIPTGKVPAVLMTMQSISGSDVFGPVHWTASTDLGKTWSSPEPIPGLGRVSLEESWERGVCDVVPEYHAATNTVLAIGHDVFYKNGVLANPQRERRPVYVVRSEEGRWSEPKHLEWSDLRASAIFTCGCSQRVNLPDGNVLVPLSFGPNGRAHRSVTTALCSFDGDTLAISRVGNELTNTAGRGLLEPSLAHLDDRFFLTLRAEDERGYVSSSVDGLTWQEPRPWCWDNGEPLVMSTTQQHWLPHSDALYLVYTRKAENNAKVMRWRAPLFMAEVDRNTLRLIRSSERVILPLIGDGLNDPKHVARMGNFHTLAVTPTESWITVGETLPEDGWRGDTLLARVIWTKPNRLVARSA